MANGSIVCPEGSVTLEIIIAGIPVYVEAAVLPIYGYKLLLGNDALRQLESISIIYEEGGEAVFSVAPEAEVDTEKEKDERVVCHTSIFGGYDYRRVKQRPDRAIGDTPND